MRFEVWSEGYADNGGRSGASWHGVVIADNFDEACIKLLGDRLDKNTDGTYRRGSYRGIDKVGIERATAEGNYSIWACQLFPTESEARKSFG